MTFQKFCHEILEAVLDGEGVGLDRAVAALVLAPPAVCTNVNRSLLHSSRSLLHEGVGLDRE